MNKFCLILSLIIVFFFQTAKANTVQDSLFLYTKSDCSNCNSVKQILQQNGIYYIEKKLEKTENANEMLYKLSLSGYHKDIFLPVIFLNEQLFHPALKTDSGLVSIPLQDVVDSIRNKFQRDEIYLKGVNTEINSNPTSNNSDCELKVSTVYLICENYKTEEEAKVSMNKLISSGYIFAGMIQNQQQFSVFSKFYYDINVANSELNDMKKIYPNAYLFQMP